MTTTAEASSFAALYSHAALSPEDPPAASPQEPPAAPRLSPRDADVHGVIATAQSTNSAAKAATKSAATSPTPSASAASIAKPPRSDPYAVLGLDRLCSDAELKTAFHRQAMRWHPDKHRNDPAAAAEAEARMRSINAAYQLLSDPSRRFMYDVKNPLPPSRHYAVSPAQFRSRVLANQQQRAEELFQACDHDQSLGYTGPVTPPPPTPPVMRAASADMPANGATLLDECPEVDADVRARRRPVLVRQHSAPVVAPSKRTRCLVDDDDDSHCVPDISGAQQQQQQQQQQPLKRRALGLGERPSGAAAVAPVAAKPVCPPCKEFSCSLEELAVGCTKRLKLTKRTVSCLTGQTQIKETVVEIPVQAGWCDGQRIAFTEADNQVTPLTGDASKDAATLAKANVVFILRERAHDVFKRDGNDLVMPCRISLQQALLGVRVDVRLLDTTGSRRVVGVRVDGVIQPGKTVSVANEGMPVRGSTERGNLRLVFDVAFPEQLSDEQRAMVPKLFA